jgi:hypothetical protein
MAMEAASHLCLRHQSLMLDGRLGSINGEVSLWLVEGVVTGSLWS